MIFGKPKPDTTEWHKWYAWRPVRLGMFNDGHWAWLEKIERRERISMSGYSWYIYREIKED